MPGVGTEGYGTPVVPGWRDGDRREGDGMGEGGVTQEGRREGRRRSESKGMTERESSGVRMRE